MTVKEFIVTLEEPIKLIFMEATEEGPREICQCDSCSNGIIPYWNEEIVSWRASGSTYIYPECYAPIVVTLKGDDRQCI